MTKSVAILQSNYIPWKGYFDIIKSVDEFIIYDDVQYTKNDWRNRNKIKTVHGLSWLTIPVVHNDINQKINETEIANEIWAKKHWTSIKQSYSKATYFDVYSDLVEELYLSNSKVKLLSEVNLSFIKMINKMLGINTEITFSTDYNIVGEKSERLVEICKKAGATKYISGAAAKSYLNEGLFTEEKIEVEWFNYSGYREHKQIHPPFIHQVTVLDLIFNEGINALKYLEKN